MAKFPSQVREDWYLDAAKAQIQSEQMTRAELLNGRVAMLGFLIGLLTELFTKPQDWLTDPSLDDRCRPHGAIS